MRAGRSVALAAACTAAWLAGGCSDERAENAVTVSNAWTGPVQVTVTEKHAGGYHGLALAEGSAAAPVTGSVNELPRGRYLVTFTFTVMGQVDRTPLHTDREADFSGCCGTTFFTVYSIGNVSD
ncbi:MAG: hypothetical protein AAB368_02385 [bacterium]